MYCENVHSHLHTQVATEEDENDIAARLNQLTFHLALVSSRTDDNTSSYPADLMEANSLLEFSLQYVCLILLQKLYSCAPGF